MSLATGTFTSLLVDRVADPDPDLLGRIRKFFTGSGSYSGYVKFYKQSHKIGAFTLFQENFLIFSGKKNST